METRTWINFTLALVILANVLHMIGFVAPMWIWLDVDSFTVGVGLWYSVGCGIKNTCDTATPSLSFGYSAEDTFENSKFKAVQAMQTLGTAAAILVLLFIILYKKGYGAWRFLHQLHLALFITSILAWLCILIGVLVFCGSFWPIVGTSPLVSSNSFPWSMFMCLLASVLFIIVSVLIHVKCWDSEFVKHAIPVSGDAQMDLHPVTKQGFWHRYFTPAYHMTRRANHAVEHPNEGHGMGITSMNARLMNGGLERRSVAAFDHMGFEGNALESGVNYRYFPSPQASVLSPAAPLGQSQAGIRPTTGLPTTSIRTFADDTDNPVYDFSRLSRQQSGVGAAAADVGGFSRFSRHDSTDFEAVPRHVSEFDPPPAGRDLSRTMSHDRMDGGGDRGGGGDVPPMTTRDVTGYYNYSDGGGVATERDVTYNTRYATSTRQTNSVPPLLVTPPPLTENFMARQESQGPYVTRLDVTGPVVTQSGAYVAGMTDLPGGRLRVLADNTVDTRFTREGRLIAGADYLPVEFRRGDRALSQTGSNYSSRDVLKSTTHLGPLAPATRSVSSASWGAAVFHPTYIYRPSSQQMY